ncbi:GNAT family N-acetyltransferase [Litorisediminicola beolgyonensis]|uniref:GNAT family N-acetyltransferase n=1 Tax=Litorisediminicola beolgyonensis TaxID=1173614 RepID=A0ABW3ZER3_9RHOB
MAGRDFIRELRSGEEEAIDRLLRAAFGGPDEAQLVKALRKTGAMAGEQVVTEGAKIVGYAALSSMREPAGWLCLAPVAVLPERQRQGIGRRLTGMIAHWAQAAGQSVVVLGDPAFYGRCGFSSDAAKGLETPYDLAHTLVAGPPATPGTRLVYPKAFGDA